MSTQSKLGCVFAGVHGLITVAFSGIFVFGKQYDILFLQAFLDLPIAILVNDASERLVESHFLPGEARFGAEFVGFFLFGSALYFAIGYVLGCLFSLVRR